MKWQNNQLKTTPLAYPHPHRFTRSTTYYTGCPKSPLTTLNLNNLKIKSRIAKPNTYLKTSGLHNFFFDIKYDVRTSFTSDF